MYAMNPVVQKLHEIRNLLARPKGWTQGVLAENDVGRAVSPTSAEAESFCLLGANRRVRGGRIVTRFIHRAIKRLYPYRDQHAWVNHGSQHAWVNHGSVADVNDYLLDSQKDALRVVDEAIVIAAASDAPQSKSSRTKNKTR